MAAQDGNGVHAQEYDIKDSNVELIGTDIDHKLKYNSAATEPAWNNGQVGVEAGLYVWRIEDFEVKPWPVERHGRFYDGDSFIVLNSVEVGPKHGEKKLVHDIFFWLGAHTSQDEAGTAAYKTVELDEFLHGTAVQHREIQQSPSDDFLHLFPRLEIRSGGVRSGFKHVEQAEKQEVNTLLRVYKHPASPARDHMVVVEVEPTYKSLDHDDVFILDRGDKVWVWQGRLASGLEKAKAATVAQEMTDARDRTLGRPCELEVISEIEPRSRHVVELLGGPATQGAVYECARPVTSKAVEQEVERPRRLFKLSDESGELSFTLVSEEDAIEETDLDGNDVFILDNEGNQIWVWQGLGASSREKASWLKVAQAYVRQQSNDEDAHLAPIAKVVEGSESQAFWRAIQVAVA